MHAESVVKSVTLNVFVVVLRLKDRHNEAGDVHSEDVPLILVIEEGGVRAGSEAEMQRTKLSLMHLHMTAHIMTSTR